MSLVIFKRRNRKIKWWVNINQIHLRYLNLSLTEYNSGTIQIFYLELILLPSRNIMLNVEAFRGCK